MYFDNVALTPVVVAGESDAVASGLDNDVIRGADLAVGDVIAVAGDIRDGLIADGRADMDAVFNRARDRIPRHGEEGMPEIARGWQMRGRCAGGRVGWYRGLGRDWRIRGRYRRIARLWRVGRLRRVCGAVNGNTLFGAP